MELIFPFSLGNSVRNQVCRYTNLCSFSGIDCSGNFNRLIK